MSFFDTDKLTAFAISEIRKFARSHSDEIFYSFAIDASLLCLNSLEKFNTTLQACQKKYPGRYNTIDKISELKTDTGSWAYQGFAEFSESCGFDSLAYEKHYDLNDEEQVNSDYANAMNEVIKNLKASEAFENLEKTDDFMIIRVEHSY